MFPDLEYSPWRPSARHCLARSRWEQVGLELGRASPKETLLALSPVVKIVFESVLPQGKTDFKNKILCASLY